jgi:hypothetical protein
MAAEMNRTPSLLRAWSPVILQIGGVSIAVAGPLVLPEPLAVFAMIIGAAVWYFGFTHGRRLNQRLRTRICLDSNALTDDKQPMPNDKQEGQAW